MAREIDNGSGELSDFDQYWLEPVAKRFSGENGTLHAIGTPDDSMVRDESAYAAIRNAGRYTRQSRRFLRPRMAVGRMREVMDQPASETLLFQVGGAFLGFALGLDAGVMAWDLLNFSLNGFISHPEILRVVSESFSVIGTGVVGGKFGWKAGTFLGNFFNKFAPRPFGKA